MLSQFSVPSCTTTVAIKQQTEQDFHVKQLDSAHVLDSSRFHPNTKNSVQFWMNSQIIANKTMTRAALQL